VGGDRDGNPAVTADVTRAAADLYAEHCLLGLENATRRLARSLTADQQMVPPGPELLDALRSDEAIFPDEAAADLRRVPEQVFRRKLSLMARRLAATRMRAAGAYPHAGEFSENLRVVQRSLVRAGAVSLEVRQHASVHRRAVEALAPELVDDPHGLDRLAREGRTPTRTGGGDTEQVLETFRAMADIQDRWGAEACHRYVISFTRGPGDVAAVRALARLAVGDRPLRLTPVPLFEQAVDLRRATLVMDRLLDLPGEQEALQADGRRVEIMLGYSDSAKEMGMLAANVTLHRAQTALSDWARARNIHLTLFHGRGGALGRGGGPANRAILSQPAGSTGGRFKVTEQGEVVFDRYGNRDIARRHLEQVANAVLVAQTPEATRRGREGLDRFGVLLGAMARASERAYRGLVGRPGFLEFFSRVTPIDEIERLEIASRPARRRSSGSLDDLRAIPWVFAWTQSRINLPGWYGLGTGLSLCEPGLLRDMYEEWPFFRSLLDNAELSLVKADLDVARRYLELGDRPDLAGPIDEEFHRTVDAVLQATGRSVLLESHPVLRRAVDLRNPYVDALSFIQRRFLAEARAGDRGDAAASEAHHLVLQTLGGVAAGLQNTG
jgi:phosphoenolpyruvate carboxylase